jgi:excisionase family DNA binding protein
MENPTLNSTAVPNTATIPPATPSPNLKTEDAAKFLNVKPTTLEQWRWNGRGPRFVKIGRSCRYRQSDLDAFLEARVFSSTNEAQASV